MSKIYEIRLREEFRLLQKLQRNSNVKDIVTIWYQPRQGAGNWIPILQENTMEYYPVRYKVRYKMPMYVTGGKLKKDWEGTIVFEVSEESLLGNGSTGVIIDGGSFPPDSVPYNKHVNAGFICTGNAWQVAMQGYGLWYFVIAVGALLNLDPSWQASNGGHLNAEAWDFYVKKRHRQPTNDIRWPFNLRDTHITIKPVSAPKKKTFTIKPL
ncbi:MAG: hypothetical protein K5920_01055 [Bacteroidales bacterium]|nr:hypothetical protein [Bacteroidales bacterium]